MPKKTKYRKTHSAPKNSGNACRGTEVSFGEYGMKAMEPYWLSSRQIEAARVSLSRVLKKRGKMWIRIFPDVPITRKPAEVRMGSGKGSVEYWVARVEAGRIMFEIDGVPEQVAREAFDRASAKLPVKTKFIKRVEA